MILPAACPDSFSVCAAPAIALGRALVVVPTVALIAGVIGGTALVWRNRGLIGQHAAAAMLPILASLVAVALHAAWVPAAPVVLYDEFLHSEITANIAERGSGHPCCAYQHGECVDGGPILWPLATHVASAAVMELTGASNGEKARARFNRMATFLSPVIAFVWCLLLIGEAWPSAAAAVPFALWPGAIRLESTADLSPGATLFLLLACCSVEAWRRAPGWAGSLATAGFLTLACHSRMEMALCVPWILWRAPGKGRIVIAAAMAVALAPLGWLIADGVTHNTIGWTNDAGATLGFLRAHFIGNVRYFFTMDGSSPVLAAAALVGLLARPSRTSAALFATFAVWIVFDSAYHIGDFRPVGGADGFRYALPIAALLVPLAASGLGAMIPDRPDGRLMLALVAVLAVPSLLQRQFYATSGRVAQMEPMATEKLSHRTWTDSDEIITRSVAYAHAKTGAYNVIERCSTDRIIALTSRTGSTVWYLRSWGDGGGSKLAETCPHPASAVPDSGDGLGPWLFEYGECHEKPIR